MLYSHKTYQTITADTENVSTDCNCVSFENKGTVTVFLKTGDTVLDIQPGEAVMYNCLFIDVIEVTFFNKVYFDPQAQASDIRKLFITREYIGSKKPDRKIENKHVSG